MKSFVTAVSLLATANAFEYIRPRMIAPRAVTGGTAVPSNSTAYKTIKTCPSGSSHPTGSVTVSKTTGVPVSSGTAVSSSVETPRFPNSTTIIVSSTHPATGSAATGSVVTKSVVTGSVITGSVGSLTSVPVVQTSVKYSNTTFVASSNAVVSTASTLSNGQVVTVPVPVKSSEVAVESSSVTSSEEQSSQVTTEEEEVQKITVGQTLTEEEKNAIISKSEEFFGEIKSGEVSSSTIAGSTPSVSTFISTSTGKAALSPGEVFVSSSAGSPASTFISTPSGAVPISGPAVAATAAAAPGSSSSSSEAESTPGQAGSSSSQAGSTPGQAGSSSGQAGSSSGEAGSNPAAAGTEASTAASSPGESESPLAFTGAASRMTADAASIVVFVAAAVAFF